LPFCDHVCLSFSMPVELPDARGTSSADLII
jgi:hypothetical protein